MKKTTILLLIAAMTLGLASCSSMESDARKVATQSHKIQQSYDGKWRISESEERAIVQFQCEMLEKYGKDRQTKEKFDKMVNAEMRKLQQRDK